MALLVIKGSETKDYADSLVAADLSWVNWRGSIALDLRAVRFVTPFVGVVAGALMRGGSKIKYPNDKQSSEYLRYMLARGSSDFSDTEKYMPIKNGATPQDASRVAGGIDNILSFKGVSETFRNISGYVVPELLENVIDHATSPDGFLFMFRLTPTGWSWPLLDTGVGIMESMRMNPDYRSRASSECFHDALMKRVSARPEGHSGEGLFSILGWLLENRQYGAMGGIISNEQSWDLIHNFREHDGIKWPGTLVWLSVPTEKQIVSLQAFWEKLGATEEEDYNLPDELPF